MADPRKPPVRPVSPGKPVVPTTPPLTYYRDDPQSPASAPVSGSGGTSPLDPKYNGDLWGMSNASNVGPLRALFGRGLHHVNIPCAVAPAGTPNQAVLLAKNDDIRPKYVRVRLHRFAGAVEGRALMGMVAPLSDDNTELVNLAVCTGYAFDSILLNGEKLWALGAWPGVVPLLIGVSVSEWSP